MPKRTIITPPYLMALFGHLSPDTLLLILTPFIVENQALALNYFKTELQVLRSVPPNPGKAEAIEVFKDLRRAYLKMSIFERERCRRELPRLLLLHYQAYQERKKH